MRVDSYAWLRDKNWREVVRDSSRLAPAIRAYLTAENRYADAVQAPLAPLRARLVAEMKGRIQPQDTGVPMPDGPYAYWRKFVPGGEHLVHVRAPRDGGDEEVLVDGNVLAKGKPYFALGDTRIHSPDHRYFAYTFDDSGSESFTLAVRDLAARRDLPEVIKAVSDFTWADSNVIYYVGQDDELAVAFCVPAPPRHRPRKRSAGLRGKGSAVFGFGRPHRQPPLRRDLRRELGHQRSADPRDREAGERTPADPGADAGADVQHR